MYGTNGSVLGATTTTAGIGLLPNTGGNTLLLIVAGLSIFVGSLIILSTVVRFIAKLIYKG